MSNLLKINNLHVNVDDKEILKGLNLEINKGEIHVLMGPNGAGKSTLSYALMGHPRYKVTDGEMIFEGEVINELRADERAKRGIFLSFQHPEEVQGITVENFLKAAKSSQTGQLVKVIEFKRELLNKMSKLEMSPEYAKRYLNFGFSGGEKKKNEILQMAILNPKLIILDETDSGLDVDAIRIVSKGVNEFKSKDASILIITHHIKILDYLKPDFVHVLVDGRIVTTGDFKLAVEIQEKGYDAVKALAN
ncbi:Vegetative protein 296 [Caloramator mitchellensis]|uniref:Vegetative protein 296 n=1 Tax=Caloramator mitchellensis TaxID=908809 RepID=A0A0R3JYN4_CALMK|nr:Fe-S cluster assembly ATPase SufC [Caloramator mitchellensis]KRQ86350.1 Vegetative protein 296 [Caloramator mitchellensis]